MSQIPVKGEHTGHHNYYFSEDFFKFEEEQGAVYLRDGQRAAKVTEAFINGLHLGIEEEVGEPSGLLMYACGYKWGVRDMKRFNERMRHEFGGGKADVWQMNMQFVFETWWWSLVSEGFGAWSLDLSFRNKGITAVEIRNSAVAQSMEMAGKPVCHLYAGLFAGVFSVFDRKERESIEIQCYSMGNDACKFLVGEQKQINAADFWVKEGASAVEVMGKLGV